MTMEDDGPANSPLDPQDWENFTKAAHDLLDYCINHLKNVRERPWKPVPDEVKEKYLIGDVDIKESEPKEIVDMMEEFIIPYGVGNTHPGFFGWVNGNGLASGILSEMVAASINANCGGRDHGSIYIERAVIDWTRRVMGFPETASGILVCGTSQATLIALTVARVTKLRTQFRMNGMQGEKLKVYAGEGVHNAIPKALEVMGIGRRNISYIPETLRGIDIFELEKTIQADIEEGSIPLAVVGTAGSVDLGLFDNFYELSALCRKFNIWLHIDGAFGAWTRLAEQPWSSLGRGIELADSLACDFHKWMHIPYDCGVVLISNEENHRNTFNARPAYLHGQSSGVGGGDPWFCDYGIDLSRGNRGLKVWTALKMYGTEAFRQSITANCQLALYMAQCIKEHEHMALAAPVVSNVCVFTADARLPPSEQSLLNTNLTKILQYQGVAVFSTTKIKGVTQIRGAITNHRADNPTVRNAINKIVELRINEKLRKCDIL